MPVHEGARVQHRHGSAACRICGREIHRPIIVITGLVFCQEHARMFLRLAIELRLRVLMQLHIMNEQEFRVMELSFRDRDSGEVEVVRVEV